MIINNSFSKFILVGFINTGISLLSMMLLYKVFLFGYWYSSGIAYIIGCIVSYFLNKKYTFNSNVKNLQGLVKFFSMVIICYFISYSAAHRFIAWLLQERGVSISIIDQVSMFIGMCLYTILNYCGQKFFVFKRGNKN